MRKEGKAPVRIQDTNCAPSLNGYRKEALKGRQLVAWAVSARYAGAFTQRAGACFCSAKTVTARPSQKVFKRRRTQRLKGRTGLQD